MAYIKDYELRQIFIEKRDEEGHFTSPCEICDKEKITKKSVDYKWGEIYQAVKDIKEMSPIR